MYFVLAPGHHQDQITIVDVNYKKAVFVCEESPRWKKKHKRGQVKNMAGATGLIS